MRTKSTYWISACVVLMLLLPGQAASQSRHESQPVSINGHDGEAIVYQIEGKSYIDLESLVRIANGSMSFKGKQIVINLPGSEQAYASEVPSSSSGLSQEFMRSSVGTLAILKNWTNTLAYGIQRGVPGDGSRMVIFRDKSAEALRLTQIAASSGSDQDALQLLTNHFNMVSAWSDKLVAERRRMDTGKYSMSQDALKNDEAFQKIDACTKFLSTMLPNGVFQDNYACH